MNKLRQLDLNLLLILQTLLEEKHVSRTAERLYKSQPAISHSLAQLRDYFNDPLLVRQNGKLVPTALAERLQTPLTQLLGELDNLLAQDRFNPAEQQRTFKLAMSDYATTIILAPLVRTLRQTAPQVSLKISQPPSRAMLLAQLESGELDLAFGVFDEMPSELARQKLFEERFICLTDKANMNETPINLPQWLAQPHILLSLHPNAQEEIERTLAKQHLTRNIMLSLPHWNASLELLKDTDYILTVSQKIAQKRPHFEHLHAFEPPIDLPSFDYWQVWHSRKNNDLGLQWLRGEVGKLFE